jgi:hypothetical protein
MSALVHWFIIIQGEADCRARRALQLQRKPFFHGRIKWPHKAYSLSTAGRYSAPVRAAR